MECGHFHHLPCVSQWLFPGGGGGVNASHTTPPNTANCLLDVSSIALPKLNRKQKAVARWVEDGYSGYSFSQPPEVRVSRISLEERRQRVPPPGLTATPALGHAAPVCHQPPPPVTINRKSGRKRKQRNSRHNSNDNDANRLPVSVSEGRALGVQVQPLMAVLMSPRPSNECSPQNILDMESEETNYTDGGENGRRTGGGPQLSVTSLELPDWSLHRLPSRPLPLRPAFRSAGRPFPRNSSSHHSSRSLALDCSKMSLSSRLQRAAI